MTHEALAITIQTGIAPFSWGSPGIGKTSFYGALALALRVPLEVVLGSLYEPSDIFGTPIVKGDDLYRAAPFWAKRLIMAGEGIILFDEATSCPPANQAALTRVILEGYVGELKLPSTIRRCAAGNPPEQAANGWDLTPPLANRFWHYQFPLDPFVWANGMISGWPAPRVPVLPDNWRQFTPHWRAVVAAYVRKHPSALYQYPKDEASAGKAWASPRTWDMSATLLSAAQAVNADENLKMILVGGAVGDASAAEFFTYLRELDLPDPEALLADPDSYQHPKRGDQAFVTLSAVAAVTLANLTPERWDAAWTIMVKAGEAGGKDIAAQAVQTLAAAKANGAKLPIPWKQITAFYPILQAAGMMPKVA